MKRIFNWLLVAVVAIGVSFSADAQVRFGIKGGASINSLKFTNTSITKTFGADNRSAFTGGVMLEVGIPLVGLCVDASALYVHRTGDLPETLENGKQAQIKRDYIDVPVNLKYKIGIPVIGNFIKPYLLTGPDFAFLVSKSNGADGFKNKSFDFAWNFGAGVELVRHIQVQASYGLGLTKVVTNHSDNIEGKNRGWNVTVAYLF